MKLNINSEAAIGSGLKKVSDFKMDMNAKAARVLSDTLYKDKHGSIIRELCSNAYDAHKESGKENEPFTVSLPDRFSPMLTIRDYGPGISPEDIDTVYSTYFASTKDHNNDSVGAFGLGSKTPFSLTDSFMVTSIHKGVKRVYNAFMNEGKPSISQFGDDEKTDEPDGLEVSITVQEKDITPFRESVRKQLRFFPVKPEINGAIEWPEIEEILLEVDGFSYFKHNDDLLRGFFIKIGPVAYPVDFEVLFSHYRNKNKEIPELLLFMERMSGAGGYGYGLHRQSNRNKGAVVDMPIGTVEVTPSREALSYSDFTLDNIVEVVEQIKSKLFGTVRDRLHEKYDDGYNTFIEYFKNLDSMMLDSIDDDYVERNFEPFTVNRGQLMIKLPEKFCPFQHKQYRHNFSSKPELMNTNYVGYDWKTATRNITTDSKGNETVVPFEQTNEHKLSLGFVTNSSDPIYIKDEAYAFATRCYEDCNHRPFHVISLAGTGTNKEFRDYLSKFAPDRVKLISETEKPTTTKAGYSTTGGRTRQWFYLNSNNIRTRSNLGLFNNTLYTLNASDEYDLTTDDLEDNYDENQVVFFTTFNNTLDEPSYGNRSMQMLFNYLIDVKEKTLIAIPRNKAKKFAKLDCAIHIDKLLEKNKDEIVNLIDNDLKNFIVDDYNNKVRRILDGYSPFFLQVANGEKYHDAVTVDAEDWSSETTLKILSGVQSYEASHILEKMGRDDVYNEYEKVKAQWAKITGMEKAEAFMRRHKLDFVSFNDIIERIKAMLLSQKNQKAVLTNVMKSRHRFTYGTEIVDPFSGLDTTLLSLTDIADEIVDRVA